MNRNKEPERKRKTSVPNKPAREPEMPPPQDPPAPKPEPDYPKPGDEPEPHDPDDPKPTDPDIPGPEIGEKAFFPPEENPAELRHPGGRLFVPQYKPPQGGRTALLEGLATTMR